MLDNAVSIICSRPESKRLPGKVFKKIAGYPALEHILKRTSAYVRTILAIPSGLEETGVYGYTEYNRLADYYGIDIWQGNAESPLHRMANFFTTTSDKSKYLVRITHDDLLIDGKTIEDLVEECDKQNAGYGITPGIVEGAGVEVIRRENLLAAAERHKEPTEYVSYFVQGEEMPFPKIVRMEPRESIRRTYRLTMDYPEDAQVLDIVLRQVGAFSSLDAVCQYIDQHPWLMNLNHQPEVTIYTCAYNAEKWVQHTIEYILANKHLDFEYVFVDDGSTDATPVIVSKFCSDPRLKIILNEKNIGLAASSNVALARSRGKYIMRVDADDIFISDWLGGMLVEMKEKKYAALYPAYSEIDELSRPLNNKRIPGNQHFHAGCALMDKRILNEVRFRDDLRAWDGLELYKRLSKRCGIGFFDRVAWHYRVHKNSMSRTNLEERKKTFKELDAL